MSRKHWYLPRPPVFTLRQHEPRPLRIPRAHQFGTSRLKFGIVTPSLNQSNFIKATIDSVLQQGLPGITYVVQDGGSTDDTGAVAAQYDGQLTWRSAPDLGQADAINKGFAGIDCDVMAYLNSDDILLPGSLAAVSAFFASHPDIDIVYGHRIMIDTEGMEIGRAVYPPHDSLALQYAGYIPQETMFWRKRVSDKIGLFDTSLKYAMDWDFMLRAQRAGFRFARIPRFIGCFRIHDEQKTSALAGVGKSEMATVRQKALGFVPSQAQVLRAILPFLAQQYGYHLAYKVGFIR